jgi:hypothetical protein
MTSDVEVQDAATVMADEEEAVEHVEGESWDGEEVHGGDSFAMIAKKRQPALGGFWAPGYSPHPARDGRLRHLEAEHEEFAVDARCTPSWILRDHLEDQVAHLFGDSPTAADSFSHFAEHGPIQFEPSLMPPNHRLGEDQKERLSQSVQKLRATTQKSLSNGPSLGLGCLRFKTVSCWRRVRFSSIRLRWVRKMRRMAPNQSPKRSNMVEKL